MPGVNSKMLVLSIRIIGLTGIVRTSCIRNQTDNLLIHNNLEWPIYVNPISLLILFWLSASAVRRQLFSVVKVGKIVTCLIVVWFSFRQDKVVIAGRH